MNFICKCDWKDIQKISFGMNPIHDKSLETISFSNWPDLSEIDTSPGASGGNYVTSFRNLYASKIRKAKVSKILFLVVKPRIIEKYKIL